MRFIHMSTPHRFTRDLTGALHSGVWDSQGILASAQHMVARKPKWLARLVERLIAAFPYPPSYTALLTYLEGDAEFARTCARINWTKYRDGRLHARRRIRLQPVQMADPPAAMGQLNLPHIPTEAALAAWLRITPGRLRWFADLCGRNRRHPVGPLRTYGYHWVAKHNGKSRLLEIPTWGLKQLQRKLLAGILNLIPAHPAAHGFRSGRSIVTNALPHCGKPFVLRLDLTDFFPSIPAARVVRLFRTVGYPETVARLLMGLCTTCLPLDAWKTKPNAPFDGSDHAEWQRFASRHLPQGAPTSPAISNLAAFRLDRRLAKLAISLDADYTRYADDLTLSGGELLARSARRVVHLIAVIAGEEGFSLNHRKTRSLRKSTRQSVTGVVVNLRPNVTRVEFDQLKAILTNCVRHGPASQNLAKHTDFRAHLAGRLSHMSMLNPNRGRKLWVIFDHIAWVATSS